MANTSIGYDRTTPFGSKIYVAVQQIELAMANFKRVKEMMDVISGGGITPSTLEGSPQFGIATGQGAIAYAAVQSINAALFSVPASYTPVPAVSQLDQG